MLGVSLEPRRSSISPIKQNTTTDMNLLSFTQNEPYNYMMKSSKSANNMLSKNTYTGIVHTDYGMN